MRMMVEYPSQTASTKIESNDSKIARHVVDHANPPALSNEQKSSLKAFSERPDSEIDYSDIPPLDPLVSERM